MRAWQEMNPQSSNTFRDSSIILGLRRLLKAAYVGLLLLARFTPAQAARLPTPAAEVPVVRADVGPCTADFAVTDNSNKPVYDAKIHVIVRYGFMGKRKQDLEIGTNSDGKARFEGLPQQVKKPMEFHVRSGQQIKTVTQDPAAECHASFTVVLGTS